MASHPYLTRSGPQGLLTYRRVVPKALRQLIGRREYLFAFRTAQLEQALPRYYDYAAQVDGELERARALLAAQSQELVQPPQHDGQPSAFSLLYELLQRRAISQRHEDYQATLSREQALRTDAAQRAQADPEALWRGEVVSLPLSGELMRHLPALLGLRATADGQADLLRLAHQQRLHERLVTLQAMLARQDLQRQGWTLPSGLACRPDAPTAVIEAEIAAIKDMLANEELVTPRLQELRSPNAPSHVSERGGGGVPGASHTPLLSVAAQDWRHAHNDLWQPERSALCKSVIDDFIAVAGDKPISDYRKSDGRAYVDVLRRMPANPHKRLRLLGIGHRDPSKIAAAAEAQGVPPQQVGTINKKVNLVHQAFTYLAKRYDECAASPVEGLQLPQRRNAKDQKEAFSVDELNTLLQAPIFTGCESERHWQSPGPIVLRSSAKFWVPLIALFTGMRLGEICQLSRRHIREHSGLHYIAVTPDLIIKTASSVRSIPIHKTLIDCGFLQFVAGCSDRLFPDQPQHASGRYSDAFSKHFRRFLKSLSLKRPGLDFHSLRHTFVAAAETSGMEFATRERLMGHALAGQAGRYGKSYAREQEDMNLLMARDKQLQRISYPEVSIDDLAYSIHQSS